MRKQNKISILLKEHGFKSWIAGKVIVVQFVNKLASHLHKTGHFLVKTTVAPIYNIISDLKGYRYDFDNQQFEDKLGRPLRRNWADALAMSSGARMARAGEGTLRRSVFLESLASSSRQEKSELLERIRDNGSLEYTRSGLGRIFSKASERVTGSTVTDVKNWLAKTIHAMHVFVRARFILL
ncbi:MAG: hypothetical protein ABL919_10460 [Methylococcales bacterium]|nr:hypothetical protein [Methylococcaceae bacterium]